MGRLPANTRPKPTRKIDAFNVAPLIVQLWLEIVWIPPFIASRFPYQSFDSRQQSDLLVRAARPQPQNFSKVYIYIKMIDTPGSNQLLALILIKIARL